MLFIQQDYQKIATVGPGGFGKTQVALAFAYSVLEKYSDVSVFWLPASSLEAFEQACRKVAGVIGMVETEDSKQDVKELVQRYLSSEKAGRWMLVVDGADDYEVLYGSDGGRGLFDYLPESAWGLTLFTTRLSMTAHELAGTGNVYVDTLNLAAASDLFKRMLTSKDSAYKETDIHKLLSKLDCLPLAITHAAAYINVNPVSIRDYLGLLESTESHFVYNTMRDHTLYVVEKTWHLSFEQIVRDDADAADLLQYMSYIDWNAIPRSILPAIEPESRLTNAIGTLRSYSFITVRRDGRTYDMHPLVQIAAKVWLEQEGLIAETQRKAVEHLSNIFPSDNWETRETWRGYLPHAAQMRASEDGGAIGARAILYAKVGRCLQFDGRNHDAVNWLEDSGRLGSNLPEDDAHNLLAQEVLASANLANGQVYDAVVLLQDVLRIRKRVLDEYHPDRLHSQQELAKAYIARGQFNYAVLLLEDVLRIRERVLDEDHPDRLHSQQELAKAYLARGQWNYAVQLLEHVCTVRERVLAKDHPDRLASQRELARLYEAAGLTDNLDSRPPSQADEKVVGGPSSATRSTAGPEGALPFRSKGMAAPSNDGLS